MTLALAQTFHLGNARGVTKVFQLGRQQVRALRGVDLEVREGEFLALVGPSGSGKTTLLNLVGALDVPTSGDLRVLGHQVATLSRRERADLRLRSIGFVFQAFNLVPVLTALENVEFVLELQGLEHRARAVLQELGLADLADRRPSELSGGQQQRVAVARAIAARPALVLADEPTANLDGENAEILMHMMRDLRERHGMTFIFSTHDPRVVAHAVRVVTLVDGRVARDEVTPGEAPHEIIPGIGEPVLWDIVPQMQVTLSKRQHIMINVGVRVPVNERGSRRTQVLTYFLWDWFDGGLFDGWR